MRPAGKLIHFSEKRAHKLLPYTYAPLTAVIFATQNGGEVSGFLSTIRFMLVT